LKNSSYFFKSAVALATSAMLLGCGTSRPFVEPSPISTLPSKTAPKTLERLPANEDDPASESTIRVDETAFMVRPVKEQSINLPDFYVHNISATESGVMDALQIMLEGVGLALNIEGGPRSMERFGASSIQNVKGGLRVVLDTLSEQIGFFWSTKNGTLTIEPDRMFVVELPPVLSEDSLASMSNTMQYLGARDTYLDRMARTIVFRANRKALNVIDEYLESVRSTRSMLVYEIQVYQVDLADGNQQGVSWNALTKSSLDRAKLVTDGVTDTTSVLSDLGKSFAMTSSGTGLGAVLMGPKFSVNALVNFLRTQGTVKTVSQPRLAMLNGAKGLLRVGETTTYVSRVGSNISSGVSQVTVETKDLRTGLELGITGEEYDSTITTRVSLQLSELVRFNKYTTLGTDLSLPDVTDRELNTTIRLPAGYTALLGGITVNRESDDRQSGLPNNTKNQEVKRSELIMVIKPTIVRFRKRGSDNPVVAAKETQGITARASSSPVSVPVATKPLVVAAPVEAVQVPVSVSVAPRSVVPVVAPAVTPVVVAKVVAPIVSTPVPSTPLIVTPVVTGPVTAPIAPPVATPTPVVTQTPVVTTTPFVSQTRTEPLMITSVGPYVVSTVPVPSFSSRAITADNSTLSQQAIFTPKVEAPVYLDAVDKSTKQGKLESKK